LILLFLAAAFSCPRDVPFSFAFEFCFPVGLVANPPSLGIIELLSAFLAIGPESVFA
jgi:hypothetical protein